MKPPVLGRPRTSNRVPYCQQNPTQLFRYSSPLCSQDASHCFVWSDRTHRFDPVLNARSLGVAALLRGGNSDSQPVGGTFPARPNNTPSFWYVKKEFCGNLKKLRLRLQDLA